MMRSRRRQRPGTPSGPLLRSRPLATAAAALALLRLADGMGGAGLVTPAAAQAGAPAAAERAEAQAAYDGAVRAFKAVLAERRAQLDGGRELPERPGQALYLARLAVMSTYKDLTDADPSRIGRPNTLGIPPAYLDAAVEPLIEEYVALFNLMQAPPAGAQASRTPLKDVADLARAIARARGLDAATVDAAGRIALGIFFGWALVRALRGEGLTVFSLPVTTLVVVVVLAALAGVVAAVLPARRAAKLDVLRAVVTE